MIVFTEDGNVDWEKSTDDDLELEPPVYACPVCGEITLPYRGSHDCCENCGWFDDPGQSEDTPDETDCANKMSLNQAREAWKNGQPIHG